MQQGGKTHFHGLSLTAKISENKVMFHANISSNTICECWNVVELAAVTVNNTFCKQWLQNVLVRRPSSVAIIPNCWVLLQLKKVSWTKRFATIVFTVTAASLTTFRHSS